MRVLVVTNLYPPVHLGGYELVCESAVNALRARGHDVHVLTSNHRRDEVGHEEHVARSLRWYPVHLPQTRHGLARRFLQASHNHGELNRQLSAHRTEVVAWYSPGGLSLSMFEAVARQGLPSVAFIEDDWFTYARTLDQWSRLFARRPRVAACLGVLGIPTGAGVEGAATWVFNSRHTAAMAGAAGLRFNHVLEAHSGCDPEFYRAQYDPAWDWRLLFVGRVEARKGVDVAVECLASLPPSAHLRIVGSTEGQDRFRKTLERRISALALQDRVEFVPPLPRARLAREYHCASVVLFPVRWAEPRGRVPLEAMAGGTPVVATLTGGAAEYLVDGRNCIAVPVDDASALAAAVMRLADDPGLRRTLQAGGFRTAATTTLEAYANRVEALLTAAVRRDDVVLRAASPSVGGHP